MSVEEEPAGYIFASTVFVGGVPLTCTATLNTSITATTFMAGLMQKLGHSKLISLPDGWREYQAQTNLDLPGEAVVSEFYLESRPDVKFHYFSSGKLIAPMVAGEFVEVLAASPHNLSADEFANVELVVRDASEPEFFEMMAHRTELISGKVVLVVEGIWKFSNLRELGVFTHSDEAGRAIDEFHCSAPREIFETYRPQFEQILYSIDWSSS